MTLTSVLPVRQQINPEDLAGVGDLAAEYQVSPQVVSNWTRRYPDFPEPVARLKAGRFYLKSDVRRWYATSRAA